MPAEPMMAAEQLHQGYFEPWLRDAGRPDLAGAAGQVRQADIGPGLALEQFLQAVTLAPPRRRRKRGPAGARAAAGHVPTREDTLIDAAPNEANPLSVSRPAPEEARRAFPTRRRLTDEQAREVTRVYAETDTPVEAIARQFGIGLSSVYRLAQQHGVPLRHAVAANEPDRVRTPAGGGRRRGPRVGASALSVAKEPAGRGRTPGTTAAVQVPRRRRMMGYPSAATRGEVAPP